MTLCEEFDGTEDAEDNVIDRIMSELSKVETEHDVRVLYATESGSRAWGMASDDSDYDVRFVYVRPVEGYLRLERTRDTIDWMLDDVLDVVGWDLCKFMRLARNSNPTVFEWLSSPIRYVESEDFGIVRDVAERCFSPKAEAYHYLGMADSNYSDWIKGEEVRAKKYLYVIRALLAARWCIEDRTPVPTLLSDLIDAKLPESLRDDVDWLLAAKASGKERAVVRRIPAIDEWISREYARSMNDAYMETPPKKVPWDDFDKAFAHVVMRRDFSSSSSPNSHVCSD